MKFDLLKTKASVSIIGLILGLAIGFKIANLQLRNEQGAIRRNAVVQAAGQFSQSTNSSNNPNLSPEQREQIISQVRAIIEKAKANPQDADAQFDAAAQYIEINQPQEALTFLEQAIKARPDDARTLSAFGVTYLMLGRFDDAIKSAKQARQIEPKNPSATLLLFYAYLESRKNLTEAEQLLREVESSSGVDPQRIATMRQDLNTARSSSARSESAPASSSTLDHGPRDQRPGGNR
jgi:Flp pilus assembly protein TadD